MMQRARRSRREIGARFDHVLVDEYQDTNVLQAEILLRSKPDGAGVTVVGDDAQAIYSFRAATVENILEFPARIRRRRRASSRSKKLPLDAGVLDAANALMAEAGAQYRKDLRSSRGSRSRDRTTSRCWTTRRRRRYVVERVLEARERGVDLRRQAVLFRTAHHSDVLELELDAAQHSVREVRRPQVSRGGARQGPAGGAALGRQSAQPHRGVSRAAAAAGHGPGELRRASAMRSKPRGSRWPTLPGTAGAGRRARGLGVPERAAGAIGDDARALGRAGARGCARGTSRSSSGSTSRRHVASRRSRAARAVCGRSTRRAKRS